MKALERMFYMTLIVARPLRRLVANRRFILALVWIFWSVNSWSFNAWSQPFDFEYDGGSDTEERELLERFMRCEALYDSEEELDALQRALRVQSDQESSDLEQAFKRARRSARLPEVIRFQTGARYDRDQQNRKRLTEDYDDYGDIRRSALENRDTFQDDVYVNVSLSADWRLSRTRWSRDEVALRREKTALNKAQKQRHQDAVRHWFALQNARLTWCEDFDAHRPPPETQTRSERARYQRARLKIWEELSTLNALTQGWYLSAFKDLSTRKGTHAAADVDR